MRRALRPQSGYTLLELVVVATCLALSYVLFGRVLVSSQNEMREARVHLRAHEDLRRNLEALSNVLRGVDVDTLGGFNAQGVATAPTFRRITGANALGRTYDVVETLRWEAVTRKVNGVKFPGRVVSVKSGKSTLVADRVPAGGFKVTLQGNALLISLSTYAATSDPRTMTVTGDSAVVSLRN